MSLGSANGTLLVPNGHLLYLFIGNMRMKQGMETGLPYLQNFAAAHGDFGPRNEARVDLYSLDVLDAAKRARVLVILVIEIDV